MTSSSAIVAKYLKLRGAKIARLARCTRATVSLHFAGKRNPGSPSGREIDRVIIEAYRANHGDELQPRVGHRQRGFVLEKLAATIALRSASDIIARTATK
jgi:hypothetical protein